MKTLNIKLHYPDNVTDEEIKGYAQSALEAWSGQYHEDDPLFYATKAPKSQMKVQRKQ